MFDSTLDLLRNRILPGGYGDVYWGLFTIALSVAVVVGYVVIVFKWFFQFKLSERAAARAAVARLRVIVACCAGLGVVFLSFNLARFAWTWRVYDIMLLLLVCYTWVFALRMRGSTLVDERLAQMAQLEQSVGRYRDIAELLPHVVWTATSGGEVDYSNRSWAQYAGGRTSWLDAVHEQQAAEVHRAWQEAVRDRVPFQREVRLLGGTQARTFVVRATPIFYGEAVKWLGACADIEDQKRLAAEQESQAKQKAFFLNALSHDLRAPLNNIALNAHLLKAMAAGPEELETINTIGENVAAAAQLLTTLLDYARAGQENNTVERVSVTALLHQVRRRFLPAVSGKNLYLRVVGDEPPCYTDRHKLERIVSNLVDNAVKHTPHGGIELSTRASGDRLSIYVTDTGGGVPGDSAPHLFEEFYQVENHERDRRKGFGLGLAICKALARQLGGDVRLARTGPEGSCFEVTISDQRPRRGRQRDDHEGHHADPSDLRLCSA